MTRRPARPEDAKRPQGFRLFPTASPPENGRVLKPLCTRVETFPTSLLAANGDRFARLPPLSISCSESRRSARGPGNQRLAGSNPRPVQRGRGAQASTRSHSTGCCHRPLAPSSPPQVHCQHHPASSSPLLTPAALRHSPSTALLQGNALKVTNDLRRTTSGSRLIPAMGLLTAARDASPLPPPGHARWTRFLRRPRRGSRLLRLPDLRSCSGSGAGGARVWAGLGCGRGLGLGRQPSLLAGASQPCVHGRATWGASEAAARCVPGVKPRRALCRRRGARAETQSSVTPPLHSATGPPFPRHHMGRLAGTSNADPVLPADVSAPSMATPSSLAFLSPGNAPSRKTHCTVRTRGPWGEQGGHRPEQGP